MTMASPLAASPVPASPAGFSASTSSPTASARSSPRSSGASRAPKPSPDTCAMILSWLRTAVPAILQSGGHRTCRSRSEDPPNTLASTLHDGVVLADLVSFLDPVRLPQTSINRGIGRNALSLPVQNTPPSSGNIDSRQMSLQYKNNTRRVIVAVKKVLDDVRAYSGFPHRPAAGAVDAFLGNVPAVPPTQDLRPTIRLAELVIATAVYGPRHNEFRHSIWRFPTKATRSAFHVAMSAVAQAVALPPPDVLYAAGPPPQSMVPPSGVMSPLGQPLPAGVISPQPRILSPRPPLSPHHPHSPLPLSPRAAYIPNPILNPHFKLSPGRAGSPHPPSTHHPHGSRKASTPPQHSSPRQKLPPTYPAGGPQKAARNVSRASPRSSTNPRSATSPRSGNSPSPKRPSSPSTGSPKRPVTATSRPSTARTQTRSPKTATVSTRSSASPHDSSRSRTRSPSPRAAAIAPLTRNMAPDAKAAPLTDDSSHGYTVTNMDDGMGARKFSMVTDESTSPPEANSRGDAPDSSGDLREAASVARQVVESNFVQSMRALEQEHRRDHRSREQTSPQYEGTSEDRGPDSKRSSEEFFTPKETSPSNSVVPIGSAPKSTSMTTGSRVLPEDSLTSPAMSQICIDANTNQYYKDTKVDETVRQSVTTSITEQISRTPMYAGLQSQLQEQIERGSRNVAPLLFRSESNTSSIDLKDPSYMLSPSASDVPSPSNQWQISQQNSFNPDILSPLPMFSPPAMPARHSRMAMATQVTPPIGAPPGPPLFRPGTYSPQLSVSSAGAHSMSDSMEPRQQSDGVQAIRTTQTTTERSGRNRSQPVTQTRVTSTTSSSQGLPPRPPKASSVSASLLPKQATKTPISSQVQMTAGKSRVSFAPTIISPGGHLRPLGEPLKSIDSPTNRPISSGSSSSSTKFSLPPSAADKEKEKLAKVQEEEFNDDDKDKMYDDDNDNNQEEGSADYDSRESSYYTAPQPDDDREHEPLESGSGKEGELDYGDDETPFQKVQEYVLYNSDEEKNRNVSMEVEEMEAADDSDGTDERNNQEDPDEEGVFDEDEEYVDDSGMQENDDVSPRDEDEDVEPAAEDEFPRGHINLRDDEMEPVASANIESLTTDQSDLKDQGRNSLSQGYVPGPADFITPPAAVRYARTIRGNVRLKEVPPTPPSPPDLNTLMESISQSKLAGFEEAEDVDDDAPVSTMQPSAGLFQKLIAVWQSADEQGTKPEDLMSGTPSGGASNLFVPEVSMSHTSAIESTIPSGDTELENDKPMMPTGDSSSRSRRPRAMRLPPAALSSVGYGREAGSSDKREEVEEGTSMASFSDAFSSDDKDRGWPDNGQTHSEGVEWEEAMKGDSHAGLPLSPSDGIDHVAPGESEGGKSTEEGTETEAGPSELPGGGRKFKSYSVPHGNNGVMREGHHVKVDRRRLDWLTKELLAARDAISRKELQMTFAETQRLEQEEILMLERQDAESVVEAMKKILAERENELHDARNRLSVAIQSGPSANEASTSGSGQDQRVSVESRSSSAGGNLEKLIVEGHARLHQRFDECNAKQAETSQAFNSEMRALWNEVQRAMVEKMAEMTEKRDEELETLRRELSSREHLINNLKQSSSDLVDQNRAIQAEASELRLQKEKTAHRYELEMSHVTAQVELVNEFSKKLHDNFRETENLRQQVLQYQDKLSHIASTSGVSQRQIKELREAVTRANDECARLRREADMAKKKGMEAVRRAEELEELRYKDAAAHSAGRFPDRQDSGSFRNHEPIRPAGHNRPGGAGVNARYHNTSRGRGLATGGTPAQKAWLVIRDKIGGIVTGKEGTSRRRAHGPHRGDMMRGISGSQSSRSQSRSRVSRDDDAIGRSQSGSRSSNASDSIGGSSIHSGPQRSNRSGGMGPRSGTSGDSDIVGIGPVAGPGSIEEEYMQAAGTYGKGEVGRIRAADF